MNLKKLTLEQMLEIYQEHMVNDFPAAELKPFKKIEEMVNRGVYLGYGLFEEQELDGYAFFVKPENGELILLDYFAICSDRRCGGMGSKALKAMTESLSEYKGMILEVENPDFAQDEESLEIMKRRIAFYERNGLCQTEVTSFVFEVEYRIMVICFDGCGVADYYTQLDGIYRTMFPGDVYDKHVVIRK